MRGENRNDEASLTRWLSEMEFSLITDSPKESLKDGEETELETKSKSGGWCRMNECGEKIECEVRILIMKESLKIDLKEIRGAECEIES